MTVMSTREALAAMLGERAADAIEQHLALQRHLLGSDRVISVDRWNDQRIDVRFEGEPGFGLERIEPYNPGAELTEDGGRVWLHREEFVAFLYELQGAMAGIFADQCAALAIGLDEDAVTALRAGDFERAHTELATAAAHLDKLGEATTMLTVWTAEYGEEDEEVHADTRDERDPSAALERLLAALRMGKDIGDHIADAMPAH